MENDSFHSEQNCIQKVAIFSQKTILLENCEPKICRIYETIYFTACLLVYYYMVENKKSLSYSPIFLDIVKKCRKFDRT